MTEYFETWDDHGRPTGLIAREIVHARGLWHKSAHVFLFNVRGELLVQRRADDKDLYPGRWDFSVGEHLQPGESYLDGALRGLREELGVNGIVLEPLLGERRASFCITEWNVLDRELQRSFRGRYDGAVAPDPVEVAAVRHVPLTELAGWIRREPDAFTPWFIHELDTLKLLPAR
jgi:isopentenyldiphosphate isomerase